MKTAVILCVVLAFVVIAKAFPAPEEVAFETSAAEAAEELGVETLSADREGGKGDGKGKHSKGEGKYTKGEGKREGKGPGAKMGAKTQGDMGVQGGKGAPAASATSA